MRHLTLTLLAFALLSLGGCRDVLVDTGNGIPQAPAPPSTAPSLYLKGPSSLRVSTQGNYRAEYAQGATRYVWRALGDGSVSIAFPYGGDTRLPVITGLDAGTVELVAEAYDASGAVIGIAAKTVSIQ